ncbi:MAG TPA: hypothetical protein VIN08_21605 [Ohtaekwangia sp.]|uniref:hypothetical protein n=1 Tax=Ohtaekwangia sp. TaxID=2066019 RepID=UPI002F9462B9
MYTGVWQIIKDDTKRTFEVCGRSPNGNLFYNSITAMQRAGMSVSCITPPISNKNSSKELVTVPSYTREDGLYERLQKQYRETMMQSLDDFDVDDL